MTEERTSWTEERLDDLSGKVDTGFERTDRRIHESARELRGEVHESARELRAEVQDLRIEMNARFDKQAARLETRFDALEGRMDRFQQTLIVFLGGLASAFIVALMAALLAVFAA